ARLLPHRLVGVALLLPALVVRLDLGFEKASHAVAKGLVLGGKEGARYHGRKILVQAYNSRYARRDDGSQSEARLRPHPDGLRDGPPGQSEHRHPLTRCDGSLARAADGSLALEPGPVAAARCGVRSRGARALCDFGAPIPDAEPYRCGAAGAGVAHTTATAQPRGRDLHG